MPGLRLLKIRLAAVYLISAAALLVSFFLYYRGHCEALRQESEKLLRAVGEFKAEQLREWRADRLERAASLLDSPILSIYLIKLADNPGDSATGELLKRRLEGFLRHNAYIAAALVDKEGRVLVSAGQNLTALCPEARALLRSGTLKTTEMSDVHQAPGGGEYGIHIAAPAASSAARGPIFLVLSLDPGQYIYPLLQKWPGPSATAETLLVRREGGEAVYLNELRHRKGTSLKLRLPLTPELPAAQGLGGRSGLFRGTDYRGEKVFSYIVPLPEFGWAMVNKIDEEEVMEDAAALLRVLLVSALALLLLGAALAVAVFKTQSAEMAAAVAASEERLRYALDTSHVGAWDLDLADHTAYRTPLHDLIFGYEKPLAEWTYEIFLSHVLPEDRERVDASFKQAVQKKTEWNFECRIKRKDGERRWIWAAGAHVPGGYGRHARLAGVVQDITERKLTEEKVLKLNRSLEEANREMENFLYITTHDLRTPLVNIQGFSENVAGYAREIARLSDAGQADSALVKRLAREKIPESLAFVQDGSRKMEALISALLKVSRAGRVELKPEKNDMGQLLKRILDAMRFQADEAGAEVTVEGPLPACLADPGAVSQIFSNLLDNAVRYRSPERPLRVRVTGAERGGNAVYEVADNGLGMAPRELERLWAVFAKPVSARAQGEGIGLPMVKRMVERSGGKITAESKAGEGSVFRVELPAA